jgi:uncharacterized protein YcfL
MMFTFPLERSAATIAHDDKQYDCFDTFVKDAPILLCPDAVVSSSTGTVFSFVVVQRNKYALTPDHLSLPDFGMYFIDSRGQRREAKFKRRDLALAPGEHASLQMSANLFNSDLTRAAEKPLRLYLTSLYTNEREIRRRTRWIMVRTQPP